MTETEKEFAHYLRMMAEALKTDYATQKECSEKLNEVLHKMEEKHFELTGKSMYQSKSIIEYLACPDKVKFIQQ